ncbi:MAG: cbb3-type cytochrome c oxidase subunit I [Thaumarchaeota archaeon]|nr:cbb3-type cytochrome c oxidase subunit I [Nitrososphaerota archaeon]
MDPWIKRWLYTTNHKDIGTLYFVSALYFGFIGALLAILMRVQLSVPNNSFLGPTAYDQAVTMHGLIMILWFLSPLAIAFANYIMPLQIGAKDMALPRLNAFGYWIFVMGGIVASIGFFLPGGAANGGWTTYAPLSSTNYSPGPGPTLAFLGLIMLTVSITMGSVNILLTIAYMRAPGMTWRKMPMFTWFILFTILQMLFSFPSLLAGLLMLVSDRVLNTVIFSLPVSGGVAAGGAVLWDDVFWFFGHPEVYVVLLPAFGMVTEIIPVFSGRPLAERNIILAVTGAVVVPLSYLVWEHHMFITGVTLSEDEAFSVATLLISLPFDIIILAFVKSLAKSSIRLTVPMAFAIGSIVLFIIGGITGVFLSSFVLDVVFRGTYFVVAHFHYVMVGAAIFGLFGGIYYYLPKMTGRLYHENMARAHFIISFIGFNVLYFPMFFLIDMPRRVYTYTSIPLWNELNAIATVGAFIFALAQILLVWNLVYTIRKGRISPPNPWGATGLEWVPSIMGASSEGGMVSSTGIVEAHGGDAHSASDAHGVEGGHEGGMHEEHMSARPVQLALGITVSFFGLSFFTHGIGGAYDWQAGLCLLLAGFVLDGYALWGWASDDLKGKFKFNEGVTERWPFTNISKMRLGMYIFLASDIIVFGAVLASYLYLRFNSPVPWPIPGSIHDVTLGLILTIILITSGLTAVLALFSARAGNTSRLIQYLVATLVLASSFMIIKAGEWYGYITGSPSFAPWGGTLPESTYFFTIGLHGAHVTAGIVIMGYLIQKARKGGFKDGNITGVENFALYWAFVDIVWMFVFPLFYLV